MPYLRSSVNLFSELAMTTLTHLDILLIIMAISKSDKVKSKESKQFPPIAKMIGHGIAPNLTPKYGPPRFMTSSSI